MHDATADPETARARWAGRYAGCGVAVRVPEHLFVLDTDPRSGGHVRLAELERPHGRLPATRRRRN